MNGFFLTVFVLLPACGGVLLIRRAFLWRFGVRVRAEIVGYEDLDRGGSSEPESIRLPKVRFRADTRQTVTITLPTTPPKPGNLAVGSTLDLVYPRNRPKRATYADRWVLFLGPALCFVPAGILLVILAVIHVWLGNYLNYWIAD